MVRRGRKRQLDVEARYWALLANGIGTVEACRTLGIGRKTGYRSPTLANRTGNGRPQVGPLPATLSTTPRHRRLVPDAARRPAPRTEGDHQ